MSGRGPVRIRDLASRSRSRWSLVVLLLCLSGWAVLAGSGVNEISSPTAEDDQGDLALYVRIADRVAAGEHYYAAAVDEQVATGYPTSPPPAIRLPTVTLISNLLGPLGVSVFRGLLAAVAVAAMLRFERASPTRVEWFGATLVAAVGLGMFSDPEALYFADAWAACLITLSLYVYRRDRWWLSLLLGAAAVAFRELAWPFLVVMGLLAWRRSRREAAAWWSAAGVFLAFYAVHWRAATSAAESTSIVSSDGWVRFGGWPHVVDTFRESSVFAIAPYPVAALALAAAIAGWTAVPWMYRDRVLGVVAGFLLLFMVAGRPSTAYWGLLYAPVLSTGIVFFPRFMRELVKAPGGRPSVMRRRLLEKP